MSQSYYTRHFILGTQWIVSDPPLSKWHFLSETFFLLKTLSCQISSQLDLFVVSPGTWRQFDGLAGSSRPGLWSFACVRGSQGMLCAPGPSFSPPESLFIDCSCLHSSFVHRSGQIHFDSLFQNIAVLSQQSMQSRTAQWNCHYLTHKHLLKLQICVRPTYLHVWLFEQLVLVNHAW